MNHNLYNDILNPAEFGTTNIIRATIPPTEQFEVGDAVFTSFNQMYPRKVKSILERRTAKGIWKGTPNDYIMFEIEP